MADLRLVTMAFDPSANLLSVQFACRTLDQFIERHRVDVGQGGMFIACGDALQVGRKLRFELRLAGGGRLLSGEGTVIWTRAADPSRPDVVPGVGLRFDRLGAESQQVLARILEQKLSEKGVTGRGAIGEAAMTATVQVAPEDVAQILAASAEDEARSMRATVQVTPEDVAHLLKATRPDPPAPLLDLPPEPLLAPARAVAQAEWLPWLVIAVSAVATLTALIWLLRVHHG